MRSLKTLVTVLLCLCAAPALAESDALQWESLNTAGYDSYNAAKCYVFNGDNGTFCSYTDAGYTSCQTLIWGYWVQYRFRGNFTRNGNYSGRLTSGDRDTLVTQIQYGNRFNEVHNDYVVVQRFYNSANGSPFTPFCEIRKKLGITYAIRSF